MGLAAPVAMMVGCGRAAALGILIRSGDVLERLAKVDRVVFDKTGTLTERSRRGQPGGRGPGIDRGRGAGPGRRGRGRERAPHRPGHHGGGRGRRPRGPPTCASLPGHRGRGDGRTAGTSRWAGSWTATAARRSDARRRRAIPTRGETVVVVEPGRRGHRGHRRHHPAPARGRAGGGPPPADGPGAVHPERRQRAGRAARWPASSGSTTARSGLSPAGKVDALARHARRTAPGGDGGRRGQRRPGPGRRRRRAAPSAAGRRRRWPTATSPCWATTSRACRPPSAWPGRPTR